ncbi:hypothetical protein [Bacillus sp. NPDC057893]|uniref:hypothetical protein n=1 Tax=Bacillus sp. NPDC057893 TaxID=3346273 RepID=UPI0036735FAB
MNLSYEFDKHIIIITDGISKTNSSSIIDNIKSFFKNNEMPNRLVFHCHGGLVEHNKAVENAHRKIPIFLENGIYPIFFVWHSGFSETLCQQFYEIIKEIQTDNLEELIEYSVKTHNKGDEMKEIWDEMKEHAEKVFNDSGAGWSFFESLKKISFAFELHLIGHSAGAIVLATLLKQIFEKKVDMSNISKSTCSLYAPACTIDLFEETYVKAFDHNIFNNFFLYTLSNELELKDTCEKDGITVYHHSLLYLVSRFFEAKYQRNLLLYLVTQFFEIGQSEEILGLQIYANKNSSLHRLIESRRGAWVISDENNQPSYFETTSGKLELISHSKHHGGFADDAATLNSTMRTILNSNQLVKEFSKGTFAHNPRMEMNTFTNTIHHK